MAQNILTLTSLLFTWHVTYASHFRGGIITWKPAGTPNPYEITLTFRVAWRRSYGSTTYCDDTTISSESLIGLGDMTCFAGCSGTIGPMKFKCTDYSTTEDWSTGERTYNYVLPNEGPFVIGYAGNAWINLNIGGNRWSLPTSVNLTRRQDTGRANSSPRSSLTPIVRLQHGCNHTFNIPVTDADGDRVRCRWAVGNQECAGVCGAFPAELDEQACQLKYQATGNLGWYGVALMIEDFSTLDDTAPLSKIPLQFLVFVYTSEAACTSKPEFVRDTPLQKACIGVPSDTTWFQQLVARAGSPEVSVTEITTVSPPGLTKSDLDQLSLLDYYINVTWTATSPERDGENIFCYTASDSVGSKTDQQCITLVGGVAPPYIIQGSNWPTGEIVPSHNTFHIEFDKYIKRPLERSVYIRFHDDDGDEVYRVDTTSPNARITTGTSGPQLEFTTDFTFKEKELYWITLDRGIVKGMEYCGPDTDPVRDTDFWVITIRDVTPPTLTWIDEPFLSNGTISFSWSFNEEANSMCTLQTPDDILSVDCNYTAQFNNLAEGNYWFYVQGQDPTGNTGEQERAGFSVDRTAPSVTTPNLYIVTNRTVLRTTYQCSSGEYRCTYDIRLYTNSTVHIDTTTSGTSFFWNGVPPGSSGASVIVHGSVYHLAITPVDAVGNVGRTVTVVFRIDNRAPTISGLTELVIVQCGDDLSPNNTALGWPQVYDDQDVDPSYSYSDDATDGCVLTRVWSAEDNAGNRATLAQTIILENLKPPNIAFPADTIVPCSAASDLVDMAEEFRRTVSITHPCNRPVEVTFSDSVEPSGCDLQFTRTWTVTDDCEQQVTENQNIRILPLQLPEYPAIGQVNVDLDEPLRWPTYPGAAGYQIYIWHHGEVKPESPTFVQNNPNVRSYAPGFTQDERILWQIAYWVDDDGNGYVVPSPVWGFTTRPYADLTVTSIVIPDDAFSGQSFDVQWTVENIGGASTGRNWWGDYIYIGTSTDISEARYVKRVRESRILESNDGYQDVTTIPLRESDLGLHYVFVWTKFSDQSLDVDHSNDLSRSIGPINIRLTPPPNLVVSIVVVPSSTFSGERIDIRFEITNSGSGATRVSSWHDRIVLSKDENIDNDDTVLSTIRHSSTLQAGASYNVRENVYIDHKIYGSFWILVVTDLYNTVYEHTYENDNLGMPLEPLQIILRPPPDLVPTLIDIPNQWVSGDDVTITYTVTNEGAGTPFETWWTDTMFLIEAKTAANWQILTQSVSGVSSTLSPTETYSYSTMYHVSPSLDSGSYTLALVTDVYNQVFELNNTFNNVLRKTLTINQQLADIIIPTVKANVMSNQTSAYVEVEYIYMNLGPGRIVSTSWVDTAYISAYSDFSRSPRYVLFKKNRNIILEPNDPKTEPWTMVPIPVHLFGSLYIHVRGDERNNIYESDEENNVESIAINVPQIQPDLIPTGMEVISKSKEDIEGGSFITVSYTVANTGSRTLTSSKWIDSLYIRDYNTDALYKLHDESVDLVVAPADDYTRNITTALPLELFGSYYLRLKTDIEEAIYDMNRENNVIEIDISIQSPPSPDLVVQDIQTTYDDKSRLLTVTWKVENVGNSMMKSVDWVDYVYLSRNTDNVGSRISSFPVSTKLFAGQKYTGSTTTVIPSTYVGEFYVAVHCDATSDVLEVNSENNNIKHSSQQISISKANPRSVSVDVPDLPTDFESGEPFVFTFTVTNSGSDPITVNSWTDALWVAGRPNLSRDEVKDEGFLIADFPHIGGVAPGESYTITETINFPYGIPYSDIFLYVFIDNNDRVGFDVSGEIENDQPISLEQGPLPDFHFADSPYSKQSLIGGAPFTFIVNITNTGEGKSKRSFYNTLYLSEDALLDPFDTKLSIVLYDNEIDVNASAMITFTETIPFDLKSGAYYFIPKLDSRNEIFESNETNNVRLYLVEIVETVSTDIAVTGVTMSADSWVYQQDVDFEWTLQNNGSLEAVGYKCDTAYLSEDTKWHITDDQVGETQCQQIRIQPTDPSNPSSTDATYNLVSTVPLVSPAPYYGIIKSRSNIRDLNLINNVGVTSSTEDIGLPEMKLGVNTRISRFKKGDNNAYIIKLVPGESTLLVYLDTDTASSYHDIYIRAQTPATRYNFDAFSELPSSANQEAVIALTTPGDYYVLVQNTGDVDSVNVDILAKLAVFEIRRSHPAELAKDGTVTMQIIGTLFGEHLTAKLDDTYGKEVVADKVYRMSSTEVYATFDCSIFTAGVTVDLILENQDTAATTTLAKAAKVIFGKPGKIEMATSGSSRLRPGEIGKITVDYSNTGDADIIAPFIDISNIGVGELRLSYNGLTNTGSSHLLLAAPNDGPTGILRPGAFGRVSIEGLTEGPGRMDIQIGDIVADSTQHPYGNMKDYMKPGVVDGVVWDVVWKNFMEATGPSVETWNSKLAEVSSRMSQKGRRVVDAPMLTDFLLREANGYLAGDDILQVNDISDPLERSDLLLSLNRKYSAVITKRRYVGSFGYGWICDMLDMQIINHVENTIELFKNGELIEFHEGDSGVYQSRNGDTITQSGDEYILRGDNYNTIFHPDNWYISKITSNIGDDELVYTYKENLATEITHTQGSKLLIRYTDGGFVRHILLNDPSGNLLSEVYYEYNEDEVALTQVQSGDFTITYAYSAQMDLVRTAYSSGDVITYEYNTKAWLSNIGGTNSKGKDIDNFELAYPESGVLVFTQHPQAVSTRFTYDENLQIICTELQDSGLGAINVQRSPQGMVTSSADQVVLKTYFDVDTNTAYAENGLGSTTSYKLGDSGELVEVTDPNGNKVKVAYDDQVRLTSIVYADENREIFSYNEDGYVSELTTRAGQNVQYEYDAIGNLFRKHADGAELRLNYDSSRRITAVVNPAAEIQVAYSDTSLPAKVSYNEKHLIYTYNDDNQRTSVTDESGFQVKYMYDDSYRISAVMAGHTVAASLSSILQVEYDVVGRVSRKLYGNGAKTEYEYDHATGWLLSIINKNADDSNINSFVYTYDKRGRPSVVQTNEGTWKLRYDAASQLVGWETPDGKVTTITYDRNGNRIKVTEDGVDKGYQTNNLNQYTEAGNDEVMYDNNGNIVQKSSSDGTVRMTYDSEGRLIQAYGKGGPPTERCDYTYDGLGNLYRKECTSSTTQYLIDPFGVYGADVFKQIKDDQTTYFVQALNLGLVARIVDGDISYFQFDGQGSVVSLTSASGTRQNSYVYDPFGNILNQYEAVDNDFTFIGQWGVRRQKELENVYDMRSRQYDSQLGRFCSPDRLGVAGKSTNPYTYASNSPALYKDPSGQLIPAVIAAGAAIGALTNAAVYLGSSIYSGGSVTAGGLAGAILSGGITGAAISTGASVAAGGLAITFAGGAIGGLAGYGTTQYVDGQPFNAGDAAAASIWNGLAALVPTKMLGYKGTPAKGNAFGTIPVGFRRTLNGLNKTGQSLWRSLWAGNFFGGYFGPLFNFLWNLFGGLLNAFLEWILSRDPNDIIGPDGYGDARFIPIQNPLDYKIRFENDENATAPAQRVFITMDLDSDLDPRTFRINSFGFGEFEEEIKIPGAIYQKVLEINGQSYVVRVRAGVDIVSGKATWEFQTLDPDTGEQPIDPGVGFLPPNNGTSGQGYVTFTIKIKKDTPSLTRIDAKAAIFFDRNEPIETPPIFNTVDVDLPAVNITRVINVTTDQVISLEKYDAGAGVKECDIYIHNQDDNTYTLLLSSVKEDLVVLPRGIGSSVNIKVVSVDHVGNRPTIDEVQDTTIDFPPVMGIECADGCTNHGTCNYTLGVCNCEDGYFGAACDSTQGVAEPPIVEVSILPGREDTYLALHLNVRWQESPSIMLSATVAGFPEGSTFEDGYTLDNTGVLTLAKSQFGVTKFKTPEHFSGYFALAVSGIATVVDTSVQRDAVVNVSVIPVPDEPTLRLPDTCVQLSGVSAVVVFEADLIDADGSEVLDVYVENIGSNWTVSDDDAMRIGVPAAQKYKLNEEAIQRGSFTLAIPNGGEDENIEFTIRAEATESETSEAMSTSVNGNLEICLQTTSTPKTSSSKPTTGAGSQTSMSIMILTISLTLVGCLKRYTAYI